MCSTVNLFKPSRTSSSQREQGVKCSSHEFGRVRLYRTFSNYIVTGETEVVETKFGVVEPPRPHVKELHRYNGNKVCRVLMHYFGVVQAHRTSSNLLEPQPHRGSKVCRGLSHEFGVVRLYRTFSNYLVTGETRCAAPRTSSNQLELHCRRESKV